MFRSAKDNELIVVYKMCFTKKLIFSVILASISKSKTPFHVKHPYLWFIVVQPILDGKSISKPAPISSDNELLAPYIIFIMTINSLSYQIGAVFEVNVHS